jgi:DNA-binding MarR family transcriptional regulator
MANKCSIRETLQPILSLVLVFKKIADRTLRSRLSITMAQFRILIAIQHNPNLSQQAIAKFWGVTEASASRQIEILDNKGLISKAHDSNNRRKYILRLTKRGQGEIKQASRLMNGVFERIFKEISDKDREMFHNLLQRFIAVIKEEDSASETDNIKKDKK